MPNVFLCAGQGGRFAVTVEQPLCSACQHQSSAVLRNGEYGQAMLTIPSSSSSQSGDVPAARSQEYYRHLCDNAAASARFNIVIQVESINPDRSIAICSVRQLHTGVLRRNYSQSELLWRAEQALAPLHAIGLVPMINVHVVKRSASPSFSSLQLFRPGWPERIRGWLGYPVEESAGPQRTAFDPFGLLSTLRRTERFTAPGRSVGALA